MSNTIGLLLIALGIGVMVALVILVDQVAKRYPHTKIGRICKTIDDLISRLPED